MNVGQTLGVARLDDVQQVFCPCGLEDRTHPLPSLHGVAGEVENDRDAELQQSTRERADDAAALRSRLDIVIEGMIREAQRGDPFVLADDDGGQGPPQLARQRRLTGSRLPANEVKRRHATFVAWWADA